MPGLDPLASGLLPVCFGQATKVCGRLLNSGKTYRVLVQLGARTESGDGETESSSALRSRRSTIALSTLCWRRSWRAGTRCRRCTRR